jgi:N-acetylglucosaminyl-diphospho-decaprenol L-rhamnosyltransferase
VPDITADQREHDVLALVQGGERADPERRGMVRDEQDGPAHRSETYDGGVPLDLAVQVVNYRTRRHLEACLPTVVPDLAGLNSRVFVLDNASGDDLAPLAAAHPDVVFETAERNLGFGAGHNRLAARHDARAVLFLNPDTRFVEPRTVVRLLEALGGDVVAVGPQLLSAAGTVDRRDHGELHGLRGRLAQAAGDSHWRSRDAPADVAWVSGAACLVDRAAFDAVGGFDEGFFLFKEEEDLLLRMRRRGGRVRYVPTVRVWHEGGVVASRDEYMASSMSRFAEKHVRGRVQRRLAPPAFRVAVVWGGRLDRLLGR